MCFLPLFLDSQKSVRTLDWTLILLCKYTLYRLFSVVFCVNTKCFYVFFRSNCTSTAKLILHVKSMYITKPVDIWILSICMFWYEWNANNSRFVLIKLVFRSFKIECNTDKVHFLCKVNKTELQLPSFKNDKYLVHIYILPY